MNWLIYTLLAIAALLIFAGGILTAYKAFIDKPRDRRKLRGWRVGFVSLLLFAAAYLLLLFATVLQSPPDADKQTETIVDSVQESEQRIIDSLKVSQAQLKNSVDSLKDVLSALVGAPKEEAPDFAESAKRQAERIVAGEILKTALDSGIVFIGLGKYQLAITHLNYAIQAAQNDSSKAEAFFYRGVTHDLWAKSFTTSGQLDSAKVQYENAVTNFDSALTYKQDDHQAWYNRGIALGKLERYEEEIASYDSALTYKHDKHEAWNNRGIALGKLERYEEAIANFDSALTYKHDKPMAWNNRGVAMYKLEQYEEAIASYDSALIYKHDMHEAWCNRGIALRRLERYDEAIASYDSALTYKHDKHEAWNNRGSALFLLGRYEEALASCDSALKYNPGFHNALELRKTILEKMNK